MRESFANHGIAVTQVFSQDGTAIEFGLEGTVDNFAPHVAAPDAFTVGASLRAIRTGPVTDLPDPNKSIMVSYSTDTLTGFRR